MSGNMEKVGTKFTYNSIVTQEVVSGKEDEYAIQKFGGNVLCHFWDKQQTEVKVDFKPD